MNKDLAIRLFELGRDIEHSRLILREEEETGSGTLSAGRERVLQRGMKSMHDIANELELSLSSETLIPAYIQFPPLYLNELDSIVDVFAKEISRSCLTPIEPAKVQFSNGMFIAQIIRTRFPEIAEELCLAGKSYAANLYAACVFHSMRSAEKGAQIAIDLLRRSGSFVKIENGKLVDRATFGEMVRGIQKTLEDLQKKRTEDIRFFSALASHLWSLNQAYRIPVAHSLGTYSQDEARRVLGQVVELFTIMAQSDLREHSPALSSSADE